MSIFSLVKGEKEHEVFKCEYVGRGSKAGLEYAGWRLESDFSEMKWRKQFWKFMQVEQGAPHFGAHG